MGLRIYFDCVSYEADFLFLFKWFEIRMVQNLLDHRPILSVNSENFLDKVDLKWLESLRKLDWLFHLANDLLPSLSSERSDALNHFEKQNAQSPDVNFIIIMFFLNHFWCHILKSSAHGGPCLKYGCKSKIAKFSNIIFCDKNILGLNKD